MAKGTDGRQWGKIHTISNKMIVYFSLLFIVVMILVGAVTYRLVSQNLEEQIIADTQKIMDQTMINVDYYFTDIKTPMIMLARNPVVIRSFQLYSQSDWPERITMRRSLEDYTRNINSFKPYIQDIILVGHNGFAYNVHTGDEISMDYDFFASPWLSEINKGKLQGFSFINSYRSEYYLGEMKYQKVVSAVLNVRENQRELGYIIFNIDLEQFNKIFDPLSLGKDGFVYMLAPDGEVIFHPELEQVGRRMEHSFMQNLNPDQKGTGSFIVKIDDKSELVVYAQSKVTNWYLVSSIPYAAVTESATEIRQIVYSILVISIVLIILISYLISRQISRPIKQLLERIKNVQTHDFKSKKTDYGKGELAIIGQKFENMVFEINKLIQDVYVSNLKQKEAELKELQSRINPHFLYNTLQLVKAEAVFGNHREVSAIVTSLGEMLRYPMYDRDALVSLSDELNYVGYYLGIFKKRFQGKIDYNIEVPVELLACKMPKLILQPVVENSIVHGFERLDKGGIIQIAAHADDDLLIVTIRDNGQGILPQRLQELRERLAGQPTAGSAEGFPDGETIGLSNVHERIRLRFGNQHGIQLESESGQYTMITITMPCLYGDAI